MPIPRPSPGRGSTVLPATAPGADPDLRVSGEPARGPNPLARLPGTRFAAGSSSETSSRGRSASPSRTSPGRTCLHRELRRPPRHLPRRAVQGARRGEESRCGTRGPAAARRRFVEGLSARAPPHDLLRRRLPAGDCRRRPRGARHATTPSPSRATPSGIEVRRSCRSPSSNSWAADRGRRRASRSSSPTPGRHLARLRQRLRPHRLPLLPHRRCRRGPHWLRALLPA